MRSTRSGLRYGNPMPDETTDEGASYREAPVEEGEEEEEEEREEWLPVSIARYDDGPAFKHWTIFVEDEAVPDRSFTCNVHGSSQNFQYELKYGNVHESKSPLDLIRVGYVSSRNLGRLKHVLQGVKIKNNEPAWNCQNFAMDGIEELAREELIDEDAQIYINGHRRAWFRMEGRDGGENEVVENKYGYGYEYEHEYEDVDEDGDDDGHDDGHDDDHEHNYDDD